MMDEKSSHSSFDTCSSNGSSEVQPPSVFRPSILNFSPKPPTAPNDPSESNEKSSITVNSLSSSSSPMKTTSISIPSNTSLKEDSATGGYVFGSNISARVINADITQGASSNLWDVAKTEVSSSSSVFTALAKAVASKKVNQDAKVEQTLEGSANKMSEDQKQAAITLSQVEAFTGEEGEIQIFRMHCRAYVFDTNKQAWNALGASHFHLNDIPKKGDGSSGYRSRVVVRLVSTRRVIINTPVWDAMPVAVVDSRSLRIGAISEDGDHLRSYLFKFPPDESASQICTAINARKIRAAEANGSKDQESTASRLAGQKRRLEPPADHHSSIPTSSLSTQPGCVVGHSHETFQPAVTSNTTCIFRPSVLCTSEGSSATHVQSASTINSGASSRIHFRQSALDPVVKRLRSDQPNSEALQNLRSDEKDNQAQSLNVPPVPMSAVMNLPTTGGVSGNFVFGENISDRVKNARASCSSHEQSASESREEDSAEEHDNVEITPCPSTLTDSASAVAAELRNKPALLLDEIPKEPIVTGEEGECTALKTYCRFYDFDRDKQLWVERGNAYVHLNDIPLPVTGIDAPHSGTATVRPPVGPPTRSRLVVRVCKTLKLLANTPLWSGLNVAMADERSIRLTTICCTTAEDHSVSEQQQSTETQAKSEFRAYLLVMRSPNDATRLYQALIARKNVTTRGQLNFEDPTETEESTPDSGAACGERDATVCLATGAVDAAVKQSTI